MKKKKTNSNKKKRIVILISAGLIVLAFTAFASSKLLLKDEVGYEPNVTSNYQPEESVKIEDPISTQEETVEEPTPTTEPAVSKWPVTYSLDQANSLTVVVNKKHKLPSSYTPITVGVSGGQLRPEAAQALSLMLIDANDAGVPMKIISSYRSYDTQVSTYNKWVQIDGKTQADRSSARPGHSEHQTGLAVDLGMPDGTCNLDICFGNTSQGKWLASNAQRYGFIIRYESDTEPVTGYQYEPWHLRYLGVDTATAVKNSGQTLDQYYGVEAGGY